MKSSTAVYSWTVACKVAESCGLRLLERSGGFAVYPQGATVNRHQYSLFFTKNVLQLRAWVEGYQLGLGTQRQETK